MQFSSHAANAANKRKEGSVAIMVAFMMVMMLGFSALVVDVGNIYRVRTELQNASDAAAMAAAKYLDGSVMGATQASGIAIATAKRHLANNQAVELREDDVQFGFWNFQLAQSDPEADAFTFLGTTRTLSVAQARQANAVRIQALRTAEYGGAVQHYFARVTGNEQSDQAKSAIALGGGPSQGCGFPLVVGECTVRTPSVDGICEVCMVMQNNNTDTMGWTSFAESGRLGNIDLGNAVVEACFTDGSPNVDADGMCAADCSNSAVGRTISVANGNNFNTNRRGVCERIEEILTRDGVANPKPFKVYVPIADTGGSGGPPCSDQFSGSHQIIGYTTVEIFGAQCGNADVPVIAPGAPAAPACYSVPANSYVVGFLRCNEEPIGTSGGGFFGLQARHFRLVR